jgi:lipopolysaccharide/colanic/teichoic acid biosynthesis glycosyltransferase
MKSPNYEYLNGPTKRRLDVMGGIALASLAAPAGVAAGIISSIDTGSLNPIFRQTRTGRASQPFNVLKFRTIPKHLEAEDIAPMGTYDPRATRVGMAMRDVGIDELPQLVNVLRGDMSLVGPRPLLAQDIERLEGISPILFKKWREIYERTKPGLIGPSQILRHNYRVSTDEVWGRAMQLDLEYAKNASLRHDIKLLGSTPVGLLVARINLVENTEAAEVLLSTSDAISSSEAA